MSSYPHGYTPKMIAAAEQVLLATAFEQHVRPVVIAYETAILERLQLRSAPSFLQYGIDKVIRERKETFMLGEDDRDLFLKETFNARDEAKLISSHPEGCPLIEAEILRLGAEQELIKSLADHPLLADFAKVATSGVIPLEERTKVIDLTLRLLSPYVRSADDLLKDLLQRPVSKD